MAAVLARTLLLSLLGLGCGLVHVPPAGTSATSGERTNAVSSHPRADSVVFLAGGLSDEDLVTLTANVAASRHPGIVLLDSQQTAAHHRSFLAAYQPAQVIPVGSFPEGVLDLQRRLSVRTAPVLPWENGPCAELWRSLFPCAEQVVLCPAQPRGQLLEAACLAGVLRAPLIVVRGKASENGELRRRLETWQPRKVWAVGTASRLCRDLGEVRIVRVADEKGAADQYLRRLRQKGRVRTLVVANPADADRGTGHTSALAAWIAVRRRAALLLTNPAGDNVDAIVHRALQKPELGDADTLILVADLKAIPMEQRPNPIPGKDPAIEMEPLTPRGTDPFTFATGRLFHEDPGVVALVLARQRLLREAGKPRKALVVSNPGGSLPLLETFSQSTAKELVNGGYQTTALLGNAVNRDDLRRLLPEQDVFLCEGHYNTLVRDYGMHEWDEPLRPSLVFLQSCLALQESKALPFLQRGAVGVVGSSTRTYSASGGACSLAFFDALLYEGQSLGGSLRHAKNFLLAYSLLKEKRLGKDAKMTGANVRSAWAFSLWGDPTLKLPRPERPEGALPPTRHQVRGNSIVVALPDVTHDEAETSRYRAQIPPNGRLAGLVTRKLDEGKQRMVPFVFAEVHLPKAPEGKTPRLHSRFPSSHYVFCWDGRRRCGYLLLIPRPGDQGEIRFQVTWEPGSAAPRMTNS